MLFCLKSGSTTLFIELSAVTSIAMTANGADVSLLGGHGVNITEDAAITLVQTIHKWQAAKYAAEVGSDSSLVKIRDDLNGSDPHDGAGSTEEH